MYPQKVIGKKATLNQKKEGRWRNIQGLLGFILKSSTNGSNNSYMKQERGQVNGVVRVILFTVYRSNVNQTVLGSYKTLLYNKMR